MIGVYDYTVILTYISLITGLTGIYFAINFNSLSAIICLMLSGLCDMFDGKVARTKKNRTEAEKGFGIQIDSLSDLIVFGVLPSAIGYSLGVDKTNLFFVLYLLPLCALIRLAYFNVEEETRSKNNKKEREHYQGLPVTTTAIILPLVYILKNIVNNYFTYIYAIFLLIISILFITKIKFTKLKTRGLIIMTLFGICVLILLMIV